MTIESYKKPAVFKGKLVVKHIPYRFPEVTSFFKLDDVFAVTSVVLENSKYVEVVLCTNLKINFMGQDAGDIMDILGWSSK
jgi:hypothetical protein